MMYIEDKVQGSKKCVIKRKLEFEDFKHCSEVKQQQHKFRGEKHDLFTEEVKMITLRANNDKNDAINRFNRKKIHM